MTDQGFPAEEIDTSRPHPARMYDYFLGGRDNYEVDREAAHRVLEVVPDVVDGARANREFLRRAVRYLAHSGIRQIIDIGTGIPTSPNTHEIAHEVSRDVRVAYIDNDPIVARHADARLLGTGNTGFFLGDMRDPSSILEHPTIDRLIDVKEPIALLLVSVLHFVPDDEDPAGMIAAYRDALPAGSLLVLSHATADFHQDVAADVLEVYKKATASLTARTHAEVLALFDGFELVEPGLVQVPLWRPDGPAPSEEYLRKVGVYGGIGRLAGAEGTA
ncbi:SAM-dependent methyltransferase [Actinacidiphila acididurans]|uniref:SAM-dependent methyltransferase n=1 Tax=Actinacidiphila acididurans TaxID=2784346 RepID=A0ABS2TUX4_9ACTN|nr:SAM-dependent methyltransferase [Actinacidiphila acididurans]MBM9507137.1 SAM-dependent methyltransferase [Actinacidiphila acididurans]